MAKLFVKDVFVIDNRGIVFTGQSFGSFNVGHDVKIISTSFQLDSTIYGIELCGKLVDSCKNGDEVGIFIRDGLEGYRDFHNQAVFGFDFEILCYGIILSNDSSNVSCMKDEIKLLFKEKNMYSFNEIVLEKANQYKEVLMRKYNQLVYLDDYDDYIFDDFEKEVYRFCLKKMGLDGNALISACALVNSYIKDLASKNKNSFIDNDFENLNPYEYEIVVARKLQDLGWHSRNTKASGDQGADVIAEKNGTTIVVQCKQYSGIVGNKAVQEVFSAKGYYGAHAAAVVSNNEYSKSAKQLANSLDVLLLHHGQLEILDKIVS